MLAPSSLLPSTDLRPHDGASSDQLARAFLQHLAQDERKRLKATHRSSSYGIEVEPILGDEDAVRQRHPENAQRRTR